VPVRVRLHDRHELGTVGLEPADVVADGIEVDLDHGRAEPPHA
jgi:hypothetical protein